MNLKNILIKISIEVSSEFAKTHPMIVISTKYQENICLGVYSQFMVTSISQAGYKIVPISTGETLETAVSNYLSQFAAA